MRYNRRVKALLPLIRELDQDVKRLMAPQSSLERPSAIYADITRIFGAIYRYVGQKGEQVLFSGDMEVFVDLLRKLMTAMLAFQDTTRDPNRKKQAQNTIGRIRVTTANFRQLYQRLLSTDNGKRPAGRNQRDVAEIRAEMSALGSDARFINDIRTKIAYAYQEAMTKGFDAGSPKAASIVSLLRKQVDYSRGRPAYAPLAAKTQEALTAIQKGDEASLMLAAKTLRDVIHALSDRHGDLADRDEELRHELYAANGA